MTGRFAFMAVSSFAVLTSVVVLAAPQGEKPKPKTVTVEGKLVAVADVLAKRYGVRMDADAAATLHAIERKDGTLFPLLKNVGSNMLFNEKRLLGQVMRIEGRQYREVQMLDVISFHVVKAGKLFEVYYWCDTCVIKVYRSGRCPCCPTEVIYRETPVDR